GNNFSGIGRLAFLNILHRRCAALGVRITFHTNVTDVARLRDSCDLVVGSDGANSLVRRTFEDAFEPSVELRKNKYIWLGTTRLFGGLTLTFRETKEGAFAAHSYKFSPTHSTFIVECSEPTWLSAGFEEMSGEETCRYLEQVFEPDL